MYLRHKDILSFQTTLMLGFVVLLPDSFAQQPDTQPGSVGGGNNQGNNVVVSTTIKTTTIKTESPSTKPTRATTEKPNLSTTSKATPEWKKTTNGLSTVNYNKLFTTRKKNVGVVNTKDNETVIPSNGSDLNPTGLPEKGRFTLFPPGVTNAEGIWFIPSLRPAIYRLHWCWHNV